jgi:hypothetical protein
MGFPVTGAAIEGRRIVGKFVLLLAGAWLVVLLAGIGGIINGAAIPWENWGIILIPGCAFVPATYFAVKLHMTTDPEQLKQFLQKAVIYGLAGLVLLIGAGYSLSQMEQL